MNKFEHVQGVGHCTMGHVQMGACGQGAVGGGGAGLGPCTGTPLWTDKQTELNFVGGWLKEGEANIFTFKRLAFSDEST